MTASPSGRESPPIRYASAADGWRIAYATAGTGTAVIYLPFLHQNFAFQWQEGLRGPYYSALAERFRLYAYDTRGQGSSQRGLPKELGIDDLVLDLGAVARQVEEPRFILYGPSPFGRVAIRYAIQHPARIAGLVLWNYVESSLAGYTAALRAMSEIDWEVYLQERARTNWYLHDRQLVMQMLRECFTQADHNALAAALRSTSTTELLQEVTVPTLVLATRADQRAGPSEESGRLLAASIPKAQLRLLDDDGLQPRDGQPASTIVAIEEFIESLDLRPAIYPPGAAGALSGREAEVLRLIAAGRSNAQIADALVISVNTVQRHVSNIFAKIGAANRAEATAYALRQGLA
jgi:DNA-binding NarL/FixJ family response regulator